LLNLEKLRPDLIAAIQNHVDEHNFTGVEFADCDSHITPETKDDFSSFLSELQTAISQLDTDTDKKDGGDGQGCAGKTISLRSFLLLYPKYYKLAFDSNFLFAIIISHFQGFP